MTFTTLTLTVYFMVLLTESDPGGELAEGGGIWVIAMGAKQFKAFINEGLQHGHPCFCAWLSPLCLSYWSVYWQRGQRFVPVYRLWGEEGRKEKNSAGITADSDELKYALVLSRTANFKSSEEGSEPFTSRYWGAHSSEWHFNHSTAVKTQTPAALICNAWKEI